LNPRFDFEMLGKLVSETDERVCVRTVMVFFGLPLEPASHTDRKEPICLARPRARNENRREPTGRHAICPVKNQTLDFYRNRVGDYGCELPRLRAARSNRREQRRII